jgi:hypothetical protein
MIKGLISQKPWHYTYSPVEPQVQSLHSEYAYPTHPLLDRHILPSLPHDPRSFQAPRWCVVLGAGFMRIT